MSVTILIPTYFGGQMLYNCLESIHTNVANPKVMIYKNEIGWLKAANELMQSVDTDVILLNDDTIVLTDIVKEMSQVAYSAHDIGIVGAKMLSPNQETVINYGIYVATDGNTAHKHFGEPRGNLKTVEVQKAVEGSCMFIKRDILKRVGYFDEGYGNGIREEVDLCFRVREAKWKVVSAPKAEVVHFGSQTFGRLNLKEQDNFNYFNEKWGNKMKLGVV